SAQGLNPGYAFDFQAEHEGKGNPALDDHPGYDEQRKKRRNSENRRFCRPCACLGIRSHCVPEVAFCGVEPIPATPGLSTPEVEAMIERLLPTAKAMQA
ncbi:MAG: hypothetical protein Q8Q16_02410, partial [Betaproteobacteria bacterium]|nr:hypothetical protein [Betaproteobacteria bacterium]